ncbi:MAG: hypothetical protein NVSMB27_25320 [Ktedonobacteraceae bacterium]
MASVKAGKIIFTLITMLLSSQYRYQAHILPAFEDGSWCTQVQNMYIVNMGITCYTVVRE